MRILREQPSALPIQASWFRKLPTSERALIFQEVGRSWRDADGLIPSNMLGLLPSQQQVVEADRITALPIMGTRVQTQAVYAAYLPWEKMREIVDRLLTHPEGERRGWGWAALLTSLRFHHDKASEVLAMIRKRKFEQDPVRLIIFQSLTALPPGIWTQAHLVHDPPHPLLPTFDLLLHGRRGGLLGSSPEGHPMLRPRKWSCGEKGAGALRRAIGGGQRVAAECCPRLVRSPQPL
jgi:hypothetical protein